MRQPQPVVNAAVRKAREDSAPERACFFGRPGAEERWYTVEDCNETTQRWLEKYSEEVHE
jgi:hypothetical protein